MIGAFWWTGRSNRVGLDLYPSPWHCLQDRLGFPRPSAFAKTRIAERDTCSAFNLQRFLYLLVTYLMYIHVGKGLPTYCVTRVVGRQPLAAKDKQSNQSTLKSLYVRYRTEVIQFFQYCHNQAIGNLIPRSGYV